MKFNITGLFAVTSLAALFSSIVFGHPLISIGFIIIVVPTIIGLVIATKLERYIQSADKVQSTDNEEKTRLLEDRKHNVPFREIAKVRLALL